MLHHNNGVGSTSSGREGNVPLSHHNHAHHPIHERPGLSYTQRNMGRRVTISDLQYFVAKADSKLRKLRATLGDYDSQDIEHHKVLKTIFSLVKKLLRLPGDDAAKEFL